MASPSSSPVMPIVVCGAREAVGQAVIEGLKPEYDVILFCVGASALATELPQLLSSPSTFTPQSSKLGSFSPSSSTTSSSSFPPRALIFGGRWGPEDILSVQASIEDAPHSSQLAIFRNNLEKQQGLAPGQPGYSEQIIRRAKAALSKLERDGDGPEEALEKVEGMEGVYWY